VFLSIQAASVPIKNENYKSAVQLKHIKLRHGGSPAMPISGTLFVRSFCLLASKVAGTERRA
jgi:hypothetical protein